MRNGGDNVSRSLSVMRAKALLDLFARKYQDLRGIYATTPSSAASAYPDVPPPDSTLSPIILAARWSSRDLYGEDMPGIAADLLEAGYDTPALRRLSAETHINGSAEVEPLVGRMFCELGIHYPLREEEANLIASRQIAREVIAGSRNAWAAASHIEIVIWGRIPGNAELEMIFSINDEIDWDAPERRSLPELDAALIDAFARLAMRSVEGVDVTKLLDGTLSGL
jgi:hypothetical protein